MHRAAPRKEDQAPGVHRAAGGVPALGPPSVDVPDLLKQLWTQAGSRLHPDWLPQSGKLSTSPRLTFLCVKGAKGGLLSGFRGLSTELAPCR